MAYLTTLASASFLRHIAVLTQFVDQNDLMFVLLIFFTSMSRDSDPYDSALNSLYDLEQVSAPLYASVALSANDRFRLSEV